VYAASGFGVDYADYRRGVVPLHHCAVKELELPGVTGVHACSKNEAKDDNSSCHGEVDDESSSAGASRSGLREKHRRQPDYIPFPLRPLT
jgi:hypothetical protein